MWSWLELREDAEGGGVPRAMWFELAGMGQRFIAKQRPWCGDKLLMTKKGTVWVGSRRSEAASGAGTNVNVWTEEAKSASKSHLSHSHYIPWRPSARTFVPTDLSAYSACFSITCVALGRSQNPAAFLRLSWRLPLQCVDLCPFFTPLGYDASQPS